MPYFKLIVFKMGHHLKPCCPDDCEEVCEHRKVDKCKLYSCSECGEFISTGMEAIRVVFQATDKMATRQAFLYGKGIGRKAKEAHSFVTFHKGCYVTQHLRWIESKLTNPVISNGAI